MDQGAGENSGLFQFQPSELMNSFADCACLVFARAKSAAKAAACSGLAYFAGDTLWINRDSTRPWNLHHHCRVWCAGASLAGLSWRWVAWSSLALMAQPRALVLIKDYQRARS